MIKLIHAADFHLDAPFSALAAERAAQRRGEQRELLDRLADLVRREEARVVLLPGDLLDSDHAYYETTQALARVLGGMDAKVFIAPGNHDFYSPRSPWAAVTWPENVHIFKTTEVEAVALPDLNCVVYGSAFTAPFRDDSPLMGFAAPQDGRVHIMCTHGDVDGKGRYGSIAPGEIADSGLDYLALGHVHARSDLSRAGKTAWAYPGCPEGRGFDELGEKGALCVQLDSGHVRAEFAPLAGRKYEILTVDVTGENPAMILGAALPVGAERDIYRILLTGESGVEGLNMQEMESVARSSFYSVSLRDHTRVRRELWSRADEDTLTGLFLREMKTRMDGAEEQPERDRLEKAVRFGLAALEDREDIAL